VERVGNQVKTGIKVGDRVGVGAQVASYQDGHRELLCEEGGYLRAYIHLHILHDGFCTHSLTSTF
jgi:hypothetical protein